MVYFAIDCNKTFYLIHRKRLIFFHPEIRAAVLCDMDNVEEGEWQQHEKRSCGSLYWRVECVLESRTQHSTVRGECLFRYPYSVCVWSVCTWHRILGIEPTKTDSYKLPPQKSDNSSIVFCVCVMCLTKSVHAKLYIVRAPIEFFSLYILTSN